MAVSTSTPLTPTARLTVTRARCWLRAGGEGSNEGLTKRTNAFLGQRSASKGVVGHVDAGSSGCAQLAPQRPKPSPSRVTAQSQPQRLDAHRWPSRSLRQQYQFCSAAGVFGQPSMVISVANDLTVVVMAEAGLGQNGKYLGGEFLYVMRPSSFRKWCWCQRGMLPFLAKVKPGRWPCWRRCRSYWQARCPL